MKSCPKCHRLYTDETFQFCLDDGADLKFVVNQATEKFEASVQTLERKRPAKKFRWLAFLLGGGIVSLLVLGLSATAVYILLRGGTTSNPTNPTVNPDVPTISAPLFGANDETEIKNLMEKVSTAFVANDTATLDDFLADEYREEDSNGIEVNKEEILKSPKIGEKVSLSYSDLKVVVKNGKATVTGRGESKFRILGTVLTQEFTFKSQLVKKDGRWQGVYSYTKYVN